MTVWTIPTQHSSFLCLTSGDANGEAHASFDPARQAAFRQRRAPPAAQFEESGLIPAADPKEAPSLEKKMYREALLAREDVINDFFLAR